MITNIRGIVWFEVNETSTLRCCYSWIDTFFDAVIGGLEYLMILFGKLKRPLKLFLVGENIIQYCCWWTKILCKIIVGGLKYAIELLLEDGDILWFCCWWVTIIYTFVVCGV